MKEFYLILGEQNTGKSSTIRALTGLRNGADKWRVKTAAGICLFYVLSQSLQEKTGVTPDVFIQRVKSAESPNVLVGLRIYRGASKKPALNYVKAIKHEGWEIREVVILGVAPFTLEREQSKLLALLPKPNYIPDSKGKNVVVSNANAHKIREWWKWD